MTRAGAETPAALEDSETKRTNISIGPNKTLPSTISDLKKSEIRIEAYRFSSDNEGILLVEKKSCSGNSSKIVREFRRPLSSN